MKKLLPISLLLSISVFLASCKKEDTANNVPIPTNLISMEGRYIGNQQFTYLFSQSIPGINDSIKQHLESLTIDPIQVDSTHFEERFNGPVLISNYILINNIQTVDSGLVFSIPAQSIMQIFQGGDSLNPTFALNILGIKGINAISQGNQLIQGAFNKSNGSLMYEYMEMNFEYVFNNQTYNVPVVVKNNFVKM